MAEIPAGGPVLDLACGGGRHTRLLLGSGHPVTAVDHDVRLLHDLRDDAGLTLLQADLQAAPWPLPGIQFAGVVVTNYLWRPLLQDIVSAVSDGLHSEITASEARPKLVRPRKPLLNARRCLPLRLAGSSVPKLKTPGTAASSFCAAQGKRSSSLASRRIVRNMRIRETTPSLDSTVACPPVYDMRRRKSS